MKIPTLEQCQEFLRDGIDNVITGRITAAELRNRIVEEQRSIKGYLESKAGKTGRFFPDEATVTARAKAKLAELERKSRQAKRDREESLRATEKAFRKQREHRQAIERRARKAATPKPAPQPQQASSKAPTLLERFQRLTGDAATRFFRKHRRELLAESDDRKFTP